MAARFIPLGVACRFLFARRRDVKPERQTPMSGAPAPVEQPVQSPPAAAQNTESGQQQEQTIPYARFKEVNDQLAELRRKDQEREAKERAEVEKRAKEQGQYQELLETRTKELDDLKPKAEQADRYAQRLHARIDAEIKEWPKELKDLVPDTTTDPEAREAQVEKLRPLMTKLQATRSPGTPPGPSGSGAQTVPATTSADLVARKRASGIY
jgi:hypothetical protein